MTEWPLVTLAAVFGLAIGSFLNVVAHRLPRRESLLSPGSHCPSCGTALKARHNVPVLSWLVLRGRCAFCAAPISPRYPLVEAATGAAFAVTALAVGPEPALPVLLVGVAAGIAAVSIAIPGREHADENYVPVCVHEGEF